MWPQYKVSPWKSIFYESGGAFIRRNPNLSTRTTKSLVELGAWYVEKSLQCTAGFTWKEAYTASLRRSPKHTSLELLRSIHALLPPEKQQEAQVLLSECIRDATLQQHLQNNSNNSNNNNKTNDIHNNNENNNDEIESQDGHSEGGKQGEMNIVTPEQKKRKRNGNDGEDERKKQRNWMREKRRAGPVDEQESLESARQEVADATGDKKQVMMKLKEVVQRYKGRTTGFVSRDFQWLRRLRKSVETMEKCVTVCYKGDEAAFLESMTKLNKISYKCTCGK